MWPRTPDVGERIIALRIGGVSWPRDVALHGVVTIHNAAGFRFLPDEPDPSKNSETGFGQSAREFSHDEDFTYGWHLDEALGDDWIPETYVILEEELPWIHRG